jgi:hypothetical protein
MVDVGDRGGKKAAKAEADVTGGPKRLLDVLRREMSAAS